MLVNATAIIRWHCLIWFDEHSKERLQFVFILNFGLQIKVLVIVWMVQNCRFSEHQMISFHLRYLNWGKWNVWLQNCFSSNCTLSLRHFGIKTLQDSSLCSIIIAMNSLWQQWSRLCRLILLASLIEPQLILHTYLFQYKPDCCTTKFFSCIPNKLEEVEHVLK